MRDLLDDAELDRSTVVANCLMNRGRGSAGTNSYAKELGLRPLDFLKERLRAQEQVAWLDLCCGEGRALLEVAEALARAGLAGHVTLVGVDLVPLSDPYPPELQHLQFFEASLTAWQPEGQFDLITCVHGLHYVGDKLKAIQHACAWLKPTGRFLAHLDLANLKRMGGGRATQLMQDLRRAGLYYHTRRHLLECTGLRTLRLPYEYVGADDRVGPNYTGQAAVDSYYRDLILSTEQQPAAE